MSFLGNRYSSFMAISATFKKRKTFSMHDTVISLMYNMLTMADKMSIKGDSLSVVVELAGL